MSATSLVTDGYICYGPFVIVPQPISLDTPEIVGVSEAVPRIQRTEVPDPTSDRPPSVVSAREIRPEVEGTVPPDPTPQAPNTTSAEEMKPVIISAEEEE
jgi:hypothetical protein